MLVGYLLDKAAAKRLATAPPITDQPGAQIRVAFLNVSVTHRGDGLPANHCNAQFRGDGKSQRAPVHRSVKQYSRCHCYAASKLRRRDQHPSTCKVSALQFSVQRARRPDHYMDGRTARAVRAWPRSVPGLLRECGL